MDKKQMRFIAKGATILLWGVLGISFLLRVGKDIVTGQAPEILAIAGFIAAVVTIVGVFSGDKIRRAIGVLWLIIIMIGVLALVVGGEFDIKWMFDSSGTLIFIGLISFQLLILPDSPD